MKQTASIDNSRVMVTGATGFIGSHLVDDLLGRGCKVCCLVRKTSDLQWLDPARVHLHTGDLSQPVGLGDCAEKMEYVFHCAGRTRAKTRSEYYRANAEASGNLYRTWAARGKRLRAVVHLSSLAAVGPGTSDRAVDEATHCAPLTYYGKSKLAGEAIARDYGSKLPIVILRPPVVYGPREKNFFSYLKTVRKGWWLQVGRTRRVLSLIYVKDLVRAMIQAATRPSKEGNAFFITDGNVYSWEEVAQTTMEILDVPARRVVIPEGTLTLMALLSEAVGWLGSGAPLLDRQRVIDLRQSAWTASSQKFFDHFNFQPQYDLKRGLTETLNWYEQNHWL